MLDSEASENVMSLKVMNQLGLKTTCHYGNVCGIDLKKVKVYGLIEVVEVYLLNIVVIDVLDSRGILFSRSWPATLSGFLNMDLTHVHIPMGDGTFDILYSRQVVKKHIMDIFGPDYHSESKFEVPLQIIEYDR
jgi:hypothetical protein